MKNNKQVSWVKKDMASGQSSNQSPLTFRTHDPTLSKGKSYFTKGSLDNSDQNFA